MIGFLDDHVGAVTAILTAVLVLVTAFYALQNWRMAAEMRRSRESAILPKLALRFRRLGPAVVSTEIRNVGPGAALHVDVQLAYIPIAEDAEPVTRRLRFPVVASGEKFDFKPPGDFGDNLNTLPSSYGAITLAGEMKDAAGSSVTVNERFENLAEWRELIGQANQRWVDPSPEKRLAEALKSKFESEVRAVKDGVSSIASSASKIADAGDPNRE